MKCCSLGCTDTAEWSIYDLADTEPDAGTDACTRHVGDLLSRVDGVDMNAPWEFLVVLLRAGKAVEL